MSMFSNILAILNGLREADGLADRINKKLEVMMATVQDFKDKFAEIDEQTTTIGVEASRISGVLSDLLTKLQSGGMTEAEEAEVFATAHTTVDALKAAVEPLKAIGSVLP